MGSGNGSGRNIMFGRVPIVTNNTLLQDFPQDCLLLICKIRQRKSSGWSLLVHEYVNNGNLEQWLHGGMTHLEHLTWEGHVKISSEQLKFLRICMMLFEPKVIHRDNKTSNILTDDDVNAKKSDFGRAKFFIAGKIRISTRVVGNFGYVAPKYASSGYLNERSDVYSFGVFF